MDMPMIKFTLSDFARELADFFWQICGLVLAKERAHE